MRVDNTFPNTGRNLVSVNMHNRSMAFSYGKLVIVRLEGIGWYQTARRVTSTTQRHMGIYLDGVPAEERPEYDLVFMAESGQLPEAVVHLFTPGGISQTACGYDAAESHKMSRHELKRGRITCGLCLVSQKAQNDWRGHRLHMEATV